MSVGAVLYNEKNEIACHFFREFVAGDDNKKYENFYLLMRETVEVDESLETAVTRGIEEEFGATGEIVRYIGMQMTKFPRDDVWVEKGTVYFLIKLKDFDKNYKRDTNDAESVSEIQWQSIDLLIEKMSEQGRKHERTDLDESEILKRAKRYIN